MYLDMVADQVAPAICGSTYTDNTLYYANTELSPFDITVYDEGGSFRIECAMSKIADVMRITSVNIVDPISVEVCGVPLEEHGSDWIPFHSAFVPCQVVIRVRTLQNLDLDNVVVGAAIGVVPDSIRFRLPALRMFNRKTYIVCHRCSTLTPRISLKHGRTINSISLRIASLDGSKENLNVPFVVWWRGLRLFEGRDLPRPLSGTEATTLSPTEVEVKLHRALHPDEYLELTYVTSTNETMSFESEFGRFIVKNKELVACEEEKSQD